MAGRLYFATDTRAVWHYDTGSSWLNVSPAGIPMVGDTGSGGSAGSAPAPPAGSAAAGKFLKADATWEIPAGTGLLENITLMIDGAGSAISTGQKAFVSVPFACTIQSVTLLSDVSGSAIVDIWKTTYTLYAPGTHPVVADSITASDLPTLSSAYKNTDSTLTGWTKTIAAGDILQFVVNSAATITRLMLVLTVARN